MIRFCKTVLLLQILVLSAGLSLYGETLSFNTADTAPYSREDNSGFYDILLTRIAEELGMDLRINHYPSKRSIQWADQGHDDGEYARIAGISETYPNLLMVKEPLVDFSFVAIVKKSAPYRPGTWQDLTGLRVGYLNGWKIFEDNLKEVSDVEVLQSVDNLFNMLMADRLDVILYSRLRALDYIRSHEDMSGLVIIDPPLSVRPMYLYMNARKADLIPLIEKELRHMKESGEYDLLLKQLF